MRTSKRQGLVAHAEKGTLLLDEVDALSGKAQIALLRMLQDKKYRPVGASVEQQADIRILAATNAVSDQLVHDGRVRADLYYRLCVFSIRLPPLRERVEDIPRLVSHFVRKHTPHAGPTQSLSPEALQTLLAYTWPGNVRELENAIIRGVHVSESGEHVSVGDLGLPTHVSASSAPGSATSGAVLFKR